MKSVVYLCPVLFLMYVNDIVSCIEGNSGIKLFADDCKFYTVSIFDSRPIAYSSLRDTCSLLVVGRPTGNLILLVVNVLQLPTETLPCLTIVYSINNVNLNTVKTIRDIGTLFSSDLKFSRHRAQISSKAYSRSHLILKCFSTNNVDILIRAYKVYVPPILESCTPTGCSYLIKDIHLIEKVQKFFTCRVCNSNSNYSDCLAACSWQSLEYRPIQFDLYMCFKIVNKLVDLDFDELFSFSNDKHVLRGHSCKLKSTTKYINC